MFPRKRLAGRGYAHGRGVDCRSLRRADHVGLQKDGRRPPNWGTPAGQEEGRQETRSRCLSAPFIGGEVSGFEEEKLVFLHRWCEDDAVFAIMSFNSKKVGFVFKGPRRTWSKILDSADPMWMGPGSSLPGTAFPGAHLDIEPLSFALYQANAEGFA